MDLIPLERFQETLKTDLEEFRKYNKNRSWSDVLCLWVADHFLRLDDNQQLRACGMQGPGEEGVDLFWVEHGGKRIIVAQAEAGKDLELSKQFSRGIIDKLRRAIAALNDEELAENRQSPIANAIEDYNDSITKGYSVELWAIIGGVANKGLQRACKRFERSDLSKYPNHSLRVLDAAALLTQYCADVEKLPYPDIILELSHKEHFGHGRNAMLATVSGRSLAKAVQDKGLSIYESNARLPLLGSPINKEIAATLGSAGGRRHFWEFNNGLTILCDDFGPAGKRVSLKGAQIVNGCQTTFTLSRHMDKLDSVEVMCRIIRRVPEVESDRIRRATNLQNFILERDLRSGDRVQKVLQMGFRRRGYFYERKRDEYKNCVAELGKVNVVAQFTKGHVDNLYLAQLALAFWHGKPAPAKMQVKKIFVKAASPSEAELPEGFYDVVFPEHVGAEDLLLPFLVSNYLYDEFSIGYRPQGARRTKRYMIQTHGNLTVLALAGWAVRSKYNLEMPTQGTEKRLVGNLLIPRFERAAEHPEFFARFNRSMEILLDGLDGWVSRAAKRQRRDEGSGDFRKIFISQSTHQDILRDRQMKQVLRRCQKYMPDLTL